LTYLTGSNCDSFTPALVTAALKAIHGAGAVVTCADTSLVSPCCASFIYIPAISNSTHSMPLYADRGFGCVQFIPGMLQNQRYTSLENAAASGGLNVAAQKSACANDSVAFHQTKWKGVNSYNMWYTPATYTDSSNQQSAMPWADPLQIALGKAAFAGLPTLGHLLYSEVSGQQWGVQRGQGFNLKNNFFNYQLTNGKPVVDSFDVWLPNRLSSQKMVLKKSSSKYMVNGLDVNLFEPDYNVTLDVNGITESQKQGQMPYWNLFNLVYATGSPLINSYPNFIHSSPDILLQNQNSPRTLSTEGGITLYRGMNDYSKDAVVLEIPEQITEEVLSKYSSVFTGQFAIEPATGGTFVGLVTSMFSTYTWNCKPSETQQGCQLFPKNSALPENTNLCHLYNGKAYACSNTNVFTPFIQGSKVVPQFWIMASFEVPSSTTSKLVQFMNAFYALEILVVLVPFFSFVALYSLYKV